MQISYSVQTLILKETFRISKGSYDRRRILIIALTQNGYTGLGEATEISYYDISLERLIDVIETNIQRLSAVPFTRPSTYHEEIRQIIGEEPFLLSAFDCAAHDLYGKTRSLPTQQILGIRNSVQDPLTSYTIGLAPVKKMIEKIKATPWPIYKIKLGSANDIELIRSLRQVTNARIRVDANEAWSVENCVPMAAEMQASKVELIEQPLHRRNDEILRKLYTG